MPRTPKIKAYTPKEAFDLLAAYYGPRPWYSRNPPMRELVITILAQHTSDTNAERAFASLRRAYPSDRPAERHLAGNGWGGVGLDEAPPPDWLAVETAPLPELVEAIRPGGLAAQKAPRIKAALRATRERSGAYDLSFLAAMSPLEARDWLTAIPGIGPKTASIVMLFCFGRPLMPVDTHVERVSKRIGLLPPKASLLYGIETPATGGETFFYNLYTAYETLPADSKAQLDANFGTDRMAELSSNLKMNPGDSFTLSLGGLKPGAYEFNCTPHLAMGMKGVITVAP